MFNQRLEGGVASRLDTSRAKGALTGTAAQVPLLEQLIAIKENQINVLLGRNPGPVARDTTLLQQKLPPEVPAGLPSALLERRPDVLAAEQNLRSANALVGVAVANFFPQVGLTALLGKVSPEVSAFTAGTANAWSIAANVTGPLFQGGALRAQYRQAKASREQAKLQYEQTIQAAFQDVSNALISREKLAVSRAQAEQSVAAYQASVQAIDAAIPRGHCVLFRSAGGTTTPVSGGEFTGPNATQSTDCHRSALSGTGRWLEPRQSQVRQRQVNASNHYIAETGSGSLGSAIPRAHHRGSASAAGAWIL